MSTKLTLEAGLSLTPDTGLTTSSVLTSTPSLIDGVIDVLSIDTGTTPNTSVGIDTSAEEPTIGSFIVRLIATAAFSGAWHSGAHNTVDVYWSEDNSTWSLAQSFSSPPLTVSSGQLGYMTLTLDETMTARYIKIFNIAGSNGGWAQDDGATLAVTEIEAYTPPPVYSEEIDDGLDLEDDNTSLMALSGVIAETIFMYDTLGYRWAVTNNESLVLADATTTVLGIAISDWLTLVDSQMNNWNGREIVPDSLTLYDLAVGSKIFSDTISESVGLSDASIYQLTLTILEYLGFTELTSATVSMTAAIAESAIFSDFPSPALSFSVADILTAVDLSSVAALFMNAVKENIGMTDVSAVYNNIGFAASESLVFAETISNQGYLRTAVYDTLELDATVELNGEVWECYVLNTPKFLPSMYSGFNFNSYCVFENRAFGANDTGIYELTGDTDAGSEIHTGIIFSATDFGMPNQKRFRRGYLGITGDSPVMVFETLKGTREVYNIDTEGKVVASSELKSKKWKLSIADFETLDHIKLIPIILTK